MIAIASGVKPEYGIYTAIIAGFLTSLLGGSRFSISGPTGAFVPGIIWDSHAIRICEFDNSRIYGWSYACPNGTAQNRNDY